MHKVKGMADVAFIAIILAGVALIGRIAPVITGKPDSVIEQTAEQIYKLQTGQEVDYSAHLKKLPDGSVVATEVKAKTTKLPQQPVIVEYPYVK